MDTHPLIKEALSLIEREPARWDQGTFGTIYNKGSVQKCGTKHCLAGHILLLSGDYEMTEAKDVVFGTLYLKMTKVGSPPLHADVFDPAHEAQRMTGITDHQRHMLFIENQQRDVEIFTKTVHEILECTAVTPDDTDEDGCTCPRDLLGADE